VPFFLGLVLMIISWYLSYPLSATSTNDLVFNHISILYWFSLPLLLSSMFLMAINTKNNFLKWIFSFGIVLTFFSLYFFYSLMPTADSGFFRGLTEYFAKSTSLDSSQPNHTYYQWPSFFILAEIVTSISGLTISSYEFLLFAVIGLMLSTFLYVYASKGNMTAGLIAVVAFFISINYFLDYQAVPFSLALGLLFLLFMLETRQKTFGSIILMIVLYASLLLTHLFVPLFFVLYLLLRGLFDKNKQNVRIYRNFFLVALVSYFLIQLTFAKFSFSQLVTNILKTPVEYSSMASAITAAVIPSSISFIAQFFSRAVTIGAVVICVSGLIFLLFKRKLIALDKALLLVGTLYMALGFVLNSLGYRALAIVFIPISIGATFFFKSKFKPYFIGLFLILIVLFLFVPLHGSYATSINYQTRQSYTADNFFINHYNWADAGFVVSDYYTNIYLDSKLSINVYIQSGLPAGHIPDALLYTPVFIGRGLGNYSSVDSFSQSEKLNTLYSDGSSIVLIKTP
jgi:hypothetical protein